MESIAVDSVDIKSHDIHTTVWGKNMI